MSESAWVLRAVDELRRNGSWTGRTHLHKLLFMADRLLDVAQPFQFELYRFGPYSYELDEHLRLLEGVGLVDREQRREGYGPSYVARQGWESAIAEHLSTGSTDLAKLARIAQELGSLKTADLEVIATCLWAARDEGISDDSAIVDRVLQLKPRYAREFVAEKLAHLKGICSELGVHL
jgi:uncharacterized protein YwgA